MSRGVSKRKSIRTQGLIQTLNNAAIGRDKWPIDIQCHHYLCRGCIDGDRMVSPPPPTHAAAAQNERINLWCNWGLEELGEF